MAQLTVRLTPRAGVDRIDAYRDGILHARVAAAPADNAANDALCRLVAKAAGVPLSSVRVVRGATSRVKRLELPLSDADLARWLATHED